MLLMNERLEHEIDLIVGWVLLGGERVNGEGEGK
jgi:hypothetical protein